MRRFWWGGVPADIALAATVTTIMIIAAVESDDEPARPVGPGVIVAIALVGAWIAFARRAPRTALTGAALTFFAALIYGIPAFSPVLPLGVPTLLVARAGHLWWGVTVLGVLSATGTSYRLFGEGAEPLGQVALTTVFDVSLLTVLLLLGETLRSRRALRDKAALQLRLADQEYQRRTTEARLRTARDLHDILSHTLALVSIQANVAAENIDGRPGQAARAVEQVRLATREAMSDLRSTIAVLREDPTAVHGPAPAPGLAQLPELVEMVRSAGLTASLTLPDGQAPQLRPAVELAVYRVVQESLTNTLRHANARSVAVVVASDADQVRVEVRDDGRGPSNPRQPSGPAGSGLRGMAERVAALRGTLWFGETGGDPAAGFTVRAQLPAGDPR